MSIRQYESNGSRGTNGQAYGTTDIARICLVTPQTVKRWIEGGKLPHFRTGGGHRRVWARDLVTFLNAHNIPVPSSLEWAGGRRALIVDDDQQVRRNVARVLGAAYPDLRIYEAADGFEAGQKVIEVAPSLIVLDMRLPGIDGLKVCRSIRSRRTAGNAKILAISGYETERSRSEAIEAGADHFLGKPFGVEELEKVVAALMPRPERDLDERSR